MKTYEQWKQQLDEMEYQPPPKPVPKAPIERKAQQPETRRQPTVRATHKSADQPSDPRKQNEKTPTKSRVVLGGLASAVKKGRKGKSQGSDYKGKKPQPRTGEETRTGSPIKRSFDKPDGSPKPLKTRGGDLQNKDKPVKTPKTFKF